MFKKKLFSILLILGFVVSANATYDYDDASLGNIAISAGIYRAKIGGEHDNPYSNTNFENELGYKDDNNVNILSIDLKNDINWLPNIQTSYFMLNSTVNSVLNLNKKINDTDLNGSITTQTKYSEVEMVFYGFLYQGPFEFDLGLKVKQISFSQTIQENNGINKDIVTVKGPNTPIIQPYLGFKFDINSLNLVLSANLSMLSIGDVEAKDYNYAINYRAMRNIYISYGYKYNSWKSYSDQFVGEKQKINIKGNYLSFKIMF